MHAKAFRRWAALFPYLLTPLLGTPVAHAEAPAFQKFFGEYVGEAISETGGELGKRDIQVKIAPRGNGFVVTWTTVIRKAGGEIRRGDTSVGFQPSDRPNIYRSAMGVDVFGNAVPLDPLRGDPYVWARIDAQTLTVYALLITDAGGYEIQVYERTLKPGGMDLRYSRVRDGRILRTVTGTLKKVR
ncbi:MAG: hypothetical protein HY002_21660 [Candidatus Rokubacteria bacterium]|nr:hypothetical protein [Candidatus Rokubacteria bacterium]